MPRRTVAYKVVQQGTRFSVHQYVHTRYINGSKHSVPRRKVMEDRRYAFRYTTGFHVFTSLHAARVARGYAQTVIAVEVSPRRWVADGDGRSTGQAVYTGLKVIGRVK